MPKASKTAAVISKLPTGIPGFDEVLHGGLPRGRNSLFVGGPGSGKTVLALQTLVNGARMFKEPGIFVAFEENTDQIISNAATFGWDLPDLQKKKLFFLDALLSPEVVKSGDFDLSALLAIVAEKAAEIGAKRVVFDAIDIILGLLDDPAAEKRELFRLHQWLHECHLTGIITAKADSHHFVAGAHALNMQFMSDCVITLEHSLAGRVSLRNLWVMKYRGSSFSENAVPMSIGPEGVELSASVDIPQLVPVTKKRVSSGVDRLDAMLGGGYFRGSSILISGAPGTSKSTLAAAFAETACRRRERVIYVTFDENAAELVRNFSSVGIDLQPHLDSGRLWIHAVLADGCSAKEHFAAIQQLLKTFQPGSLVLDPLTALLKSGGEEIAQNISERLMRLSKSLGVTVLNTSLLNSLNEREATPIQISTIADTWIHLSYQIQAGERNRALTIVKSRGTRHSNQVRELILDHTGITLADVYTSEGEVLMGTMRWQKEQAVKADQLRLADELAQKRRELELSATDIEARRAVLQCELELKRTEVDLLIAEERLRRKDSGEHALSLLRQRDDTAPEIKNQKP